MKVHMIPCNSEFRVYVLWFEFIFGLIFVKPV